MNTLDYFLKANLYGLLFVSCYWLFLRRHTFFSLNRVYLLFSAIASLVLPLASLPTQTAETLPVPMGVIVLPVSAVAPTEEMGPDWQQIGLIAYGAVALLLVLRLVAHTVRLMAFIRRSNQAVFNEYVVVEPTNNTTPTFSFFRYLVLNPADKDNILIINHELVHIRQYHSVDVLGMALLKAVFWACPALWLLDRMLRQVHEFLADKAVSQPTDYARFLLHYTFGQQPDALVNGFFNPSLLKQRILMLHQKATTRWALGKYVLILPLALGLLAMTTAREQITDMVSQVTDETTTVSGRVTNAEDGKSLPGAMVVIANTGKGTPTDADGHYQLKNVPKDALLSVSFVGFTTMSVPVEGKTVINIALAPTNPNELPVMGATKAYKGIKPNPKMPVRVPPTKQMINGQVYTAVEEPAVFPTGIPGLMQYVAHTLRYPAKAKAAKVEGNVVVEFVVLPTGAIGSPVVKKGLGSGCDEEALRVVSQMPKWIPGQQNGKPVATKYALPIQFQLEKLEDKRTGKAPANQLDDVWVVGYEPAKTTAQSPNNTTQNGEVFLVVEQVPEFPGGMRALSQYLARSLRYPNEARQNRIQGRVYVQFVVTQEGNIQGLRILKGIGGGCDEEAIRVISQMPKWTPGKQNGQVVSVQYNLPIQFQLEKPDDKRTGQVLDSRPDSSKKLNYSFDTSKNGRYALYNDVNASYRLADSSRKPNSFLTLRGNAFHTDDPLYIIDGIEVPRNSKSNSASRYKTIRDLQPDDIENITVLKDASAVSAYGEKGKNGVVLITTKTK